MRVVHERCCGLDVHKRTVVACVMAPDGQQVRTFGTMTRDLLALTEWLRSVDVSHVAMESTGVFWQPIYNVLEDAGLDVLVANARHIKAVPGRKTDVKDAEWIADLLRHGLIRGSAIPNRARRELRELVRYRLSLSRQRAQVAHRIHKVLEGANIKLTSVVTDLTGVSGRAMLEALIEGRTRRISWPTSPAVGSSASARNWSRRWKALWDRINACCWPATSVTLTSWPRRSRG